MERLSLSPRTRSPRLLAVALTATVALACASVAQAAAVSVAGAERPWQREWASYLCQTPDRVTRSSTPVAQGSRAYRLEVRDGDDAYGERCELSQGNPTRAGYPVFQEGQERWISWKVYLPSDFPLHTSRWNVISQWKQLGSMGPPVLSMEVTDGRFHLVNNPAAGVPCCRSPRWSGPASPERWVDFTLHVKFSPDPAVGFVELYGDLDGGGKRLLLPRTSTHTMKRDGSGRAVPSHSRIGIYRDPAIQGTAHVLFDEYVIASSPPGGLR